MRERVTSTDGFSLLAVMLAVLILAVVGFTGLFMYKEHHGSGAPTKTVGVTASATSNPYHGWLTFSDSSLNLKYPSGWQVEYDLSSAAAYDLGVQTVITSSAIPPPAADPGAYAGLSMHLSDNDSPIPSCTDYTCRITATVKLHNPQLSNTLLAIVNQTSPTGTTSTQFVVVNDRAKVGNTTITPAKLDNGLLYIYGQPVYGNNNSSVQNPVVTDAAALQANATFKAMVNLLDSVVFK